MALTSIGLGHIQGHEKTTAKLYFQPNSTGGYYEVGNILECKYTPEQQTVTRMVARDGARFVNDEQVNTRHDRWEVTGDDMNSKVQELLLVGTANTDVDQALQAAPAGTAQFTGVTKGLTYFLGRYNVDTVVVKVGATAKTVTTDYVVDAVHGSLIIPSTSTILSTDTVDVTFGSAAQKFNSWTGQNQVLFQGAIRLLEFNQFSKAPLNTISFTGVLNGTAWPEQTGEFARFTLRATPTGAVTKLRRYAGF